MANSVEILPAGNSVELSTFDVATTTYFLSSDMMLDKHEEVGADEV
jgi:hypothetical protein